MARRLNWCFMTKRFADAEPDPLTGENGDFGRLFY